MRRDKRVNFLLELLHFLVVLLDVLLVDQGTQQAIRRVLVLRRGNILHHELAQLFRVQVQVLQCLLRNRLLSQS